MNNLISDVKVRRTVYSKYDLTLLQKVAIDDYISGRKNGRQAALSIGMPRQQFVNLVFAVLPQIMHEAIHWDRMTK